MSSRTRRARVSALTAAVAGLAAAATTAVASPPAQSAPAQPQAAVDCPAVYPVSDLSRGQDVTGLTVSTGTTPESFDGKVLGVVKDGIATGMDMIMVQATSGDPSTIGIWSGMSGSPVYASDGRLIGAVSYGLAYGPSPVAGVTPAADMRALLGGTASTATAQAMAKAGHISLPVSMQRRLVANGLASPSEAGAGIDRLPLPLAVSGMINGKRLDQAASRLGLSDVRIYRAGSASVDPAADTVIFPVSNLAASMSYGDFTAAAIGTTTMVCGDKQVVGFGHPLNWTGDSTYTMHGADAVYVQADPTLAGFKVANLGGPVGEITGDHGAGISGPIGTLPASTWVHSVVSMANGGTTRTGDSYISVPDLVRDAVPLAEMANQDRVFDRLGKGSSMMHVVIDGHTAAGKPFTVTRTNRFVSGYDISVDSISELGDYVAAILDNRFTDVTIDDVQITTQISPAERRFSVGKVQWLVGGHYVTLAGSSIVRGKAGSTVTLRVTLNSPDNEFGSKVATLHVKVPNGKVGTSGWLVVGRWGSRAGATSFDGLLTKLANAPRNDQLRGEIGAVYAGRAHRSTATTVVRDVIQGRTKNYRFRISG